MMPPVTAFGIASCAAAAASYGLQSRSHWFTFAFAWACALTAVYAFLAGAPLLGLLQIVWYLVAMRRWINRQAYE